MTEENYDAAAAEKHGGPDRAELAARIRHLDALLAQKALELEILKELKEGLQLAQGRRAAVDAVDNAT